MVGDSKLKDKLLREFYETPSASHACTNNMMVRLSAFLFWKGIRKSVDEFVKFCLVCQQTKYSTQSHGRLFATTTNVRRHVGRRDHGFHYRVTTISKGITVIFVVVDRLTKYAQFGTLPTSYNATQVDELFMEIVVKHHRFRCTVVSDQDAIFVCKFSKHYFCLSGTNLNYSTAYHLQTDGQTEVVNKGVEQYLWSMVSDQPHSWARCLLWAEFFYNTSF